MLGILPTPAWRSLERPNRRSLGIGTDGHLHPFQTVNGEVKLRIDDATEAAVVVLGTNEHPRTDLHHIPAQRRTLDTGTGSTDQHSDHRISPPGSSLCFGFSKPAGLVRCRFILTDDGFRQNLSRGKTRVARAGSPCHRRSQDRREGLGRQGRHCNKVPKRMSSHVVHVSWLQG